MRRVLRVAPASLLLASLAVLLLSRGGGTVPLFAARTGLMCQNCHFDPNGGGPRNDFGFAYARNRHSVDAEPDSASPWASLDLTNKVGETFPLHISVNQRFMLLDSNTDRVAGNVDRFGFFDMESNLHFAFQPHHRLTLVYSLDGFAADRGRTAGSMRTKEAFGMIGLPGDHYIKAGRFRPPYGLRMDDHTVATRNAFLDFSTQELFLPYDQRIPDMGVEVGGAQGGTFARAAYTNGNANVLAGEFAETKSLKVGYNMAGHQGAFSIYDEYNKEGGDLKRATRWGYYGTTAFGPLALLGEVAAGTDEGEPVVGSGMATGTKTNRLAWFAEVDYTPVRWLNGRLRYDYLVMDRSGDPLVRENTTHQRYGFEAEWLPVPFAELRAVYRVIDHKGDAALDPTLEDETQGYLQFHFVY